MSTHLLVAISIGLPFQHPVLDSQHHHMPFARGVTEQEERFSAQMPRKGFKHVFFSQLPTHLLGACSHSVVYWQCTPSTMSRVIVTWLLVAFPPPPLLFHLVSCPSESPGR